MKIPLASQEIGYAKCEWLGHEFMLVDTGGIEPESDDIILAQMRRQAELAILKADVTILVTDLKCGVTATDYEVAQMLFEIGQAYRALREQGG